MEPRPLRHYVEGEYAPLDMPAGWHLASLACFAAALGARFLVGLLLPARWPSSWTRPLLPGLAVFLFAVLGIGCGLLGLRNARGRGVARVGIFLNAVVLVLTLLAAFAFYAILRR
ncbi:MAG TPA: hypothetical protein VLX28_18410 [Thermoanaerobaculia bacterium]|nr:hypothetical protein [Thermoanaerobaculia bacterium]